VGVVTVVALAGVDAGPVDAVVVRVPDELTLVAHITGTAESGRSNDTCNRLVSQKHVYHMQHSKISADVSIRNTAFT